MAGPLSGARVVELVGLGPGPFAGMILADLGAEVIRVDRAGSAGSLRAKGDSVPTDTVPTDTLGRGRKSIAVDLKNPDGAEVVLKLVERADAIFEGLRPGVTERLGVGPDACMKRNPKIVYGRMTGWGQDGPYANAAGHDINYAALSGALSMIGRAGEPPVPPVNFLADFGGGGMFLALGIVSALWESARSGKGQVVDTAMVDGAALLSNMMYGFAASGMWQWEKGTNLLDTGAWYYDTYETSDGKYVSFGSLEPQFFTEMLRITGLADDVDGGGPVPNPMDRSTWPEMKRRMAKLVSTKTRDEWCKLLEHTDACFAPVLTPPEAMEHPHNKARGTFVDVGGVKQPAPAPRFSRTKPDVPTPAAAAGAQTDDILSSVLRLSKDEVASLRSKGAVA